MTGGEMGEMPTWYPVIKVAQFLGVDPDWLDANPHWYRRGLVALNAENGAKNASVTKVE